MWRHARSGHRPICDLYEEANLAFGLRATHAGVGFMPSRAWLGTDLPRARPDVKTVADPYSGQEYTAFPALRADAMVIHARVAGPQAWLRFMAAGSWIARPTVKHTHTRC